MIDTNSFILKYLNRKESLFAIDLENNKSLLNSSINNKSILVIGGAGTIGSSFIKAALKFKPDKLVVVDVNENGLTELVRDLRSIKGQYVPKEFYTYPLSFDSTIFEKLFMMRGPFDIVANFAAHKHVRSEKDIYSVQALLENNLIKAKSLLDILVQYPPEHFFCVSTDKAANPVNIMGASKKMMEELILSYSGKFKISTARFANVAFSNGSLLEGFLKRMEKKQPLACPSDVKRFFVSYQESGEICLLACILGNTGQIFFPRLDVIQGILNFVDILYALLEELDYQPVICASEEEAKNSMHLLEKKKYPVYLFESNTSGEKLYEEFYTGQEKPDIDFFNALGILSKKPSYTIKEFENIIVELKNIFNDSNISKSDIVNWLKKYVPDFEHIETGINLDEKM
ncbi:polysaccharide biosynthesis protein [Daejeonella sp.]|uniref:polysaccharide biosynthesis protein n=1 Tax=Daejeonella sp. TaxID=2805397 RepID=UPI002D015319|nr:polysaccharide biosynthesis protein [Daejeonella sp.]HQT58818.1 polysaccharide biosynthesis protein [Daejeonella sp.]